MMRKALHAMPENLVMCLTIGNNIKNEQQKSNYIILYLLSSNKNAL